MCSGRAGKMRRRGVLAEELAFARHFDHEAVSGGFDDFALTRPEQRLISCCCVHVSSLSVVFGLLAARTPEGKRRSVVAAKRPVVAPAYFAPMDVEMRHLRALLALADELNVTRAAERLHLTQQALSGQIRQLEQRVGAQLVQRDPRHVELTRAGVVLCERARPLLASAEHAIAATRAAGRETARLTIGYIAPLTRRLVAPALQRFSAAHPNVELTIHFASFVDPLGGLRQGAADVAILYGEFEHNGIELRPLFSEPRGVALAADHPLAAKPTVAIEDLLREPLVDVPTLDRRWRDFWTAASHRGGEPPRVGAAVQTLDGLVEAVGAGLGVATSIAPAIEALGSTAGVVFRPVPGLAPLDFWVAHPGVGRAAGRSRWPRIIERHQQLAVHPFCSRAHGKEQRRRDAARSRLRLRGVSPLPG
jgi:DNA-binding transcriptional LysR family regulator